MIMVKGCSFLINQQIWKIPPGKMVCGNTNEKQEMMKKVAGPPHYPLVHGVFLHKKWSTATTN
jgi:hypothetical protein